jgi:hypothetical protein
MRTGSLEAFVDTFFAPDDGPLALVLLNVLAFSGLTAIHLTVDPGETCTSSPGARPPIAGRATATAPCLPSTTPLSSAGW